MDCLTYKQRTSTVVIPRYGYMTEKWFGSKSLLASDINRGFADNSLSKQSHLKQLKTQKFKALKVKYEIVAKKARRSKFLHDQFKEYKNNLRGYAIQVSYNQVLNEKMQIAALKIQKVYRGYVTRKNLESTLIDLSRRNLNKKLAVIETSDKFALYYIGKKPEQSVKLLQRFFRKVLFKRKISRLQSLYWRIMELKELKLSKSLRKYFSMINCRISLLENKEYHLILQKLLRIRENLAIIKIKKLLKLRKIKVKSIRHRIRRFTKNNTVQSLPPPSQSNSIVLTPHTIPDPIPATIPKMIPAPQIVEEILKIPPLKLLNSLGEISVSSEENQLINTLRKQKLSKACISYNVNMKRSLNYFPLFIENDPDSRPQTTRSTTNRIILSNPLRIPPKPLPTKFKQVQTSSQKKSVKRYTANEEPPYMKDTKSSILRYEETPSPEIPMATTRKTSKNKILCPTFSFTQRTRSAETQIIQKPPPAISRPTTGPKAQRKVLRSVFRSEVNIVQPGFNPPNNELSDMEIQNFRPFFIRIRPALEKFKLTNYRAEL